MKLKTKELKDLIDTVEKETETRTELELNINALKEEINRLKLTIKDQQKQIEEQGVHPVITQIDLPNGQIDNLTTQLDQPENQVILPQENNKLLQAQEVIFKLSEECDTYRNEINNLQNQLNTLNMEKTALEESNQAQMEENEEMVNIKRLNFQLMEENGLLRVEIESVRTQMEERIEASNSEALETANNKIEALTMELEDYNSQLQFLQRELEEKTGITKTLETTSQEIIRLKGELSEYQNENKELITKLAELKKEKIDYVYNEKNSHPVAFNFPRTFQITLFKKMYYLLNDSSKQLVIDTLIRYLNDPKMETKRIAIRILSEIKDKKVYEAFLDLVHDKDWLIRYNLIKALSKFDFEEREFIELLKELSRDPDVDVRELALKILKEFSQ
ncbi:MAG: HEAT repeat domain-containing protein [Promethearchaeota archaeon]